MHFLRGLHYKLIEHLTLFDGKEGGEDDLFDALYFAVQASETRAAAREEEPEKDQESYLITAE